MSPTISLSTFLSFAELTAHSRAAPGSSSDHPIAIPFSMKWRSPSRSEPGKRHRYHRLCHRRTGRIDLWGKRHPGEMARGAGEAGGTHKDRETLLCVLRSGIPRNVSPALRHMKFLNWNTEWAKPGTRRELCVAERVADHAGYSLDISVCEV